jgi:HIV Tat-specific factor 1
MAIIKNVFILEDLDDDGALLEIKADMRSRAKEFGEVTNVTLYDKEHEGVVVVRFKDWESAEAFQKATNGRYYNNNHLKITIAEDRPKFSKSGNDNSDIEDDISATNGD